jgi:CTD small phosphatase-like protein 2
VRVPVHFPTGEFIEAGINIRPYAKEILERLNPHFEILIFTASHSCYANPVIDHLDP